MAKTAVEERPTTRAVAKYIGRSPYKVRHVVGLIRGLDAEAARNELLLCERGAAEEVTKLLNSAIANAEHNQQIPGEELRVKEAFVDEGPTMKRFKARARGRGNRILKRTSHITIILERMTEEDIADKAQRESNTGAANAREQRRRRAEASKAAARAKAEAELEADEASSANAEAEEETTPTEAKTAAPKKTAEKKPAAKKAPAKKPASKKVAEESSDGASGANEETTGSESAEGREAATEEEAAATKPKAKKAPAKKPAAKKSEEKEGDA